GLRLARREDDAHDVVPDLVVDVHLIDQRARGDDVPRGDDWVRRAVVRRRRHAVEDLPLLLARGILDPELQHEAVDLGLGRGLLAAGVGGWGLGGVARGSRMCRCSSREGYSTLSFSMKRSTWASGSG